MIGSRAKVRLLLMKKLAFVLSISLIGYSQASIAAKDSIRYEQMDNAIFKCITLFDPSNPMCFYKDRWLLIGRSRNKNILRDIQNKPKNGYWVMANDFLNNVSAISEVEFNCKNRSYRQLRAYGYNGLYLNGQQITEESTSEWETPLPMSSAETMLDFYCKHDDPNIKKDKPKKKKDTVSL